MVAIIIHHVVRRDESRHVTTGFSGQIGINRPIVARSAGTFDGFEHIVATAVVSRDGQCPISERIVEIFEVFRRRARRFDRIATLVDQAVHRQTVVFRRRHHELPQSRRSHVARRHRVERTFYHREILQFEGNTLSLQSLFEERHIKVLHTQHEAHRTTQAAGVVVDIILHHVIVGHLHHIGQATQAVDIDLAGVNGILVRVQRRIHPHVFPHIPSIHQRVDIVQHALCGRHISGLRSRLEINIRHHDRVGRR